MKTRLINITAILIITAALTAQFGLLAGCENFDVITGKGETISRDYHLTGFDRIEVSHAFEVEITPADDFSVSISAYENLFDYINVSMTTDTLKIAMKMGTFTTSNPRVTIQLPKLTYLSLTGAAHGSARGFSGNTDLTLVISGLSKLEIETTVNKGRIEVSGASTLEGGLTAKDATIEISGASRVELSGKTPTLDIEVSGASTADLFDFVTQTAWTSASGASTINLTVNEKLDVEVSGASTLNYKGTADLGRLDVSGASSIHKK
jgi:hypothetical protein